MRVGATDFLEKPVSRERLFEVLDRILAPAAARRASRTSRRSADGSRYGMVGRSEAMRRIYQLVEMAAPTKCRVLIAGESGTGKELIARAIHALSPRRDAALRRAELRRHPRRADRERDVRPREGRLHGRGRATARARFEAANGGTLFLDEIGDMSLDDAGQAPARAPGGRGDAGRQHGDARPVDVRIVSATSKNLPDEIARGALPRGPLPPPQRADHRRAAAARAARGHPGAGRALPAPGQRRERRQRPSACRRARSTSSSSCPGTGNVRELRNLMERLVVLVSKDVVGAAGRHGRPARWPAPAGEDEGGPLPLREARARFERAVHPLPPLGQPRQPGRYGARPGHRADEPVSQDEAARDPAAARARRRRGTLRFSIIGCCSFRIIRAGRRRTSPTD